ncbi:hypothetical protein LSTR_LSTR007755 [Laodelphax striatellus]|uniref:Uncharacterized protein n=1 Tax=Laodelphax striatellus TaxID=195883 RepID=A0A482WJL8_LAOST|nr:hypothetical protein LSTR_LSTR007755 [Laodelphax striatellus]
MLSYMVPSLEEKPPPVPQNPSTSTASKDHRLQLSLAPDRLTNGQLTNGHHAAPALPPAAAPGGRKAAVSTESSASSLSSSDTHDKPKPKLLNGATKHTSLKRNQYPITGEVINYPYFKM